MVYYFWMGRELRPLTAHLLPYIAIMTKTHWCVILYKSPAKRREKNTFQKNPNYFSRFFCFYFENIETRTKCTNPFIDSSINILWYVKQTNFARGCLFNYLSLCFSPYLEYWYFHLYHLFFAFYLSLKSQHTYFIELISSMLAIKYSFLIVIFCWWWLVSVKRTISLQSNHASLFILSIHSKWADVTNHDKWLVLYVFKSISIIWHANWNRVNYLSTIEVSVLYTYIHHDLHASERERETINKRTF